MTMGYRWVSSNRKQNERREGEAPSLLNAKADAEKAHETLGYHGTVTHIYGPRATLWQYVPKERTSGMKWEKL
jgi:hypothetical protein